MKVECIHFDLDSVLYVQVNFLKNALRVCAMAMIEQGLRATLDQAHAQLVAIRQTDANAGDHFDRLCHHFNGCCEPLIIAAGVEKYWDCKLGFMMPAPHAHPVLGRLAQQYPLTVISNGIPVKQAAKLFRIGLSQYFNQVDDSPAGRRPLFFATAKPDQAKPHPYLWQEAHKAVSCRFGRAIMVGDRYGTDMLGAKRLGMITVKIDQGEHRHETLLQACQKWLDQPPTAWPSLLSTAELKELMQPDYTIETLAALPAVVEKIEARLEI